MLRVAAAGLNETVEVALVLEHLAVASEMLLMMLAHDSVCLLVPELKRRQNLAEVVLGVREHGLHGLVRLNREDGDVHGLGAAGAHDRDTSDDTQASLGADEELLEVEP